MDVKSTMVENLCQMPKIRKVHLQGQICSKLFNYINIPELVNVKVSYE